MIQMRIANSALKRFVIKIDGAGARAERFITKVYSICAAVDGGVQGGFITGRAKKLGQIKRHGQTRFRFEIKKGAKGKHPTRRFG